ncbi:recombinase family protein [Streptomyces sp. B21-106]|uniref:recombinase family protein n=1 Tax=Streptomyces sp. B21-106 TaxID=3039418 RepID=UPI002FEEB592
MTDTTRSGRRMVIYARISDDREGRQNGVDRQERQCRALAGKNGDEVVAVFTDDDRSAYSGKPRPDYLKMLAFLAAGHAEGAYALAPTRFYRRLEDGLEFFRLIVSRRLEVETVKAGRYNLSTADGRRDALRAAVDAQHEAEQISERVRDAKADSLARGEYRGGPRPSATKPTASQSAKTKRST